MDDNCTHDCSTCTSDCESHEQPREPLHPQAEVRKVFAVPGSKGGVGKSTITALCAARMQSRGKYTAVFDADITGPSIPTAFGVTAKAAIDERGFFPLETENGTQIMSVNSIIPNPADPVLARGALVENTIKKFWSEVIWEDVDIMLIDMPSGTGEVVMSVLRHLPIDGAIVITTPQDIASLMTEKTLKMAKALGIPVCALVENMAYFKCPDCGKTHELFGDGMLSELAAKYEIETVVKLPLDTDICKAFDSGTIEELDIPALDDVIRAVLS